MADLLESLPDAMGARAADEGRSFFSKPGGGNRVGEKLFSELVTLKTDPFDARLPGAPWSGERLPAQATTWIERGVVQALPVGRYWAAKTGRAPRPAAGTVVMDGGEGASASTS